MYHFYLFFIEVWLIYNVMLVSGIQQSDSCVCVCIYPFSDSFPLYGITKYWVQFLVLYSRYMLVLYFIYEKSESIWRFQTPWTVPHQAPLSWNSSGKNPGVTSHSLLQCIYVNPEFEIYPSSPSPFGNHKCVFYVCGSNSGLYTSSFKSYFFIFLDSYVTDIIIS